MSGKVIFGDDVLSQEGCEPSTPGGSVREPKRSWRDRSELASLFIRKSDSVCDLGAGSHTLKRFLPPEVGYIPVDRLADVPGTFFADFNAKDFTLPPFEFNVLTALGHFNYLSDLERFMMRLTELNQGKFIIFTYDFWKIDTQDLTQPIRNSLDKLEDGVLFFSKFIRNLTPVAVFRRRVMFTGTLGLGEPETLIRSSATKLACRNIRPQEYVTLKLFDVDIMPRWLA